MANYRIINRVNNAVLLQGTIEYVPHKGDIIVLRAKSWRIDDVVYRISDVSDATLSGVDLMVTNDRFVSY